MRKIFKKDLPVFQFHLLQKFSDDLEHAVTCRIGGVSKAPYDGLNLSFSVGDDEKAVKKNRQILSEALGVKNIVGANQTHSKNILVIDEEFARYCDLAPEPNNIDGFVTALSGIGLLLKVADCQAILMFDPVKKVIAAVHAGWKGQVQDISGQAIKIMRENFGVDPANILVGISPSLGPCCAFFSDPRSELPKSFEPFILDNNRVDLWGYSLWQLQQHGILPEHIELARVCSFCGGHGEDKASLQNLARSQNPAQGKFYSFRRDLGITGRFGGLIALR